MRWAGYVKRMREVYRGIWWGKLRERHRLKNTSVDGRIILRLMLMKWDLRHGLDGSG